MNTEEQKQFDKMKEALEFARGALADAIGCPDGPDDGTGLAVIGMINEALGDGEEWHKTIAALPEL